MTQKDRNTVVEHLEAALAAASELEMPATELAGLLFFYAHNVTQGVRDAVTVSMDSGE